MPTIMKDEIVSESHPDYTEWDRRQFIITLAKGESITIQLKNSAGTVTEEKTFTAQYLTTQLSCHWQDKGVKTPKALVP